MDELSAKCSALTRLGEDLWHDQAKEAKTMSRACVSTSAAYRLERALRGTLLGDLFAVTVVSWPGNIPDAGATQAIVGQCLQQSPRPMGWEARC